MPQLPLYKKLISYLVPVLVRKSTTAENPLLELYAYRGRYQLATFDAIYSDGQHYTPLNIAYKQIDNHLPQIKKVLVLGTGLGSAVQIMTKMGYSPDFTLIEYDNTILQWAMELMPEYKGVITPVCADAQQYMAANTQTYDLVVIDIFKSRVVPPFVTSQEFLTQCRNSINPGGHLIMNYIVQQNEEWHPIDAILRSVFPKCYCIDNSINRIIIATV